MRTKKERIVRYTADELRSLRARGVVGSDLSRAAQTPVPEGSNPDDAIEPLDMDWVTTEIPMPRRKEHTTLRMDADTMDWFRAQGRGYQSKINAVLRSYFEQRSRSRG